MHLFEGLAPIEQGRSMMYAAMLVRLPRLIDEAELARARAMLVDMVRLTPGELHDGQCLVRAERLSAYGVPDTSPRDGTWLDAHVTWRYFSESADGDYGRLDVLASALREIFPCGELW